MSYPDEGGADIAVFAFRRPEHLERTLRSLKACWGFDPGKVTVFVDGPRNDSDVAPVSRTREVATKELPGQAKFKFSKRNLGLSASIIRGVSDILSRAERVIVVEDDLDLSPGFLDFLNCGLHTYAQVPEVWQVSGHQFNVPAVASTGRALFMPFSTSWGWGTWRRAWSGFDSTAAGWETVRADSVLRRSFNLGNTIDYSRMLIDQMAGRSDSWAIRFYWSMFRANGLCLFPPESLVRNTGMDGTGTHGRGTLRRMGETASATELHTDMEMPRAVQVDPAALSQVIEAIRRQNGGGLGRLIDRLRWAYTLLRG